jgi:alkylhydroperoxidase/carboxymuconolactone decarboxylase family protein YurZ
MTQADMDRDAIKAEFQRERGYWRPWNETLLREQPEFLLAYARYAGHPARTGSLSTRMVELIYVGLDASSSHLFESGLRIHMQKAKEAGASHQDIFDLLQLVAEQGLACVLQSIHVLAEETGDGPSQHQSTDEHAWDWLSQHDPVYAELARTFGQSSSSQGGLSPSERCLVQIALHACFTAFNPVALRACIRQGVEDGLTTADMLQAIQLGAHLSVHGTALGAQVFESLE